MGFMMMTMLRCAMAMILAILAGHAVAAEVALVGVLGSKALLVIDGGAPRTLAVGQLVGDVKLLSVSSDTAEIEIRGQRSRLRMGDSPVSVGERNSAAKQVTLVSDVRGHFSTSGSINGANVTFLVDTGASSVAMGASTAMAAGIDFRKGEPGMAGTANGVVPMWRVRIRNVRIGDILLNDVEGAVMQVDMPYVLLGMSFLNRMEMRRDGSTMVLTQRY
ncbi:TIGR02281 family clan AA aspartic protease [Uliginosibacterium sp. IMCC34675]|uniref:TIGR02281 family clan AA aspartic protease n=2 Tax=Uliginosibacterium aquaticum TaxID=2731212 RepID=A0ABX2IRI8_9RHOO|nr:TIGR02281 family clan AA aspartic protease [Uliginosibacterium aquaticum]